MSITREQHDTEATFGFLGIVLPAAVVAGGAGIAYTNLETVREYVGFDELVALEAGALLVLLSGVWWMWLARRYCEDNH